MEEVWLPIPGHEGRYEVSDHGNVKSLPRVITWMTRWGRLAQRPHKGGFIHADPHHTGYLQIKLGGKRIYRIHQLVAWTFLGPQPPGTVINHIDGNKTNNKPWNLEYISNSDNVKHAYQAGLLSNRGATNGKAVLNDDMVRAILALPKSMMASEAAVIVGCKKHNVVQVRQGRWSHIPRE